MNNHLPRYKVIPHLSDTAGFFDFNVPYTNQSQQSSIDSLKKFYDFGIYDYISPKPVTIELNPGLSIFQSHQLIPSSNGPKLLEKQSTDWFTFLVILCLILIAWMQTNHSKRLKQIIRSVALPYYVNQLEREGNLYNERITLVLGFVYLTSISLMLYQFSRLYGFQSISLPDFVIFALIFTGVISYILVKALIIKTTGFIFKTSDITHTYRLNALIFNHTTGLVVFPLLLLTFYWRIEPFVWIAAAIISILVLYRFMRSISIGLSNTKFSIFYLILYLCTLEILPLLIMVKAIRQF